MESARPACISERLNRNQNQENGMETKRPDLICTKPGPGYACELQTDTEPRVLVGAIYCRDGDKLRLTESEAREWAEYVVRACNNHDKLCRALGEIATSVTYALASKQCPAKMRGGLRAIADAATSALDKTLLAQADPAAVGREPEGPPT